MSTFDQLAQRVLGNLQGFSLDQDQITYLGQDITSSDLSFSVGDPREVSRGMIEIGDEILWVQLVDSSSGSVTIIPQGRGYLGSTAASHTANTTIKNNPKWPKVTIKAHINDTIRSTFPDLFQLKSTTFTFTAAKYAYELPAEVEEVYDVSWDVIGPSQRWPRLNRWRFMPNANVTDFTTGKALELLDAVVPGRTVQVTYIKAPQPLSSGSDEFATVSGLSASAEDVVVYGACYRMSGYLDIPRLQTSNIEETSRAQIVPPGAATNAAKYFYALYRERLDQERQMLLSRYPRLTHSTRI